MKCTSVTLLAKTFAFSVVLNHTTGESSRGFVWGEVRMEVFMKTTKKNTVVLSADIHTTPRYIISLLRTHTQAASLTAPYTSSIPLLSQRRRSRVYNPSRLSMTHRVAVRRIWTTANFRVETSLLMAKFQPIKHQDRCDAP